jgi:colanic acid biosynthesis glycosyl transferase WcaI
VDRSKVEVIQNWAPLNEIRPLPHDNAWAREQGLESCKVVIYSGTLGLKHDPGMLLEVALRHRDDPGVKVVVISQGLGAAWLSEQAADRSLDNLVVLPYQPYERLSEVLATGDVLTALLTGDAAVYSVPSKVLSYLSAGRPVVAAIAADNLIAQQLRSAGGTVVEPRDGARFADAIDKLLANEAEADDCGRRARAYAEQVFDIQPIANSFESLLIRAGGGSAANDGN